MNEEPGTNAPPKHQAILTFRRETFTVRSGMTLRKAIMKVGLSPEAILAVKDGELLTDEVVLETGDQIRLVAIISGG